MVVVVQLAERQIVALEVKGSTPFDHPTLFALVALMGCRQVVRHWTLTPTLRRFESYHPSQKRKTAHKFGLLSQALRESLFFALLAPSENRTLLAILCDFW